MKIHKIVGAVAAAAITLSFGAITAAPAGAANNIKLFGQPESINDLATGGPLITYTVHGLKPSSDAVFHNGRLYEATVTNDGGIPIAALFNARAESGANYRVIGGGIPGKLYFDVVGDTPNSVVYNDGVQDLLVWVSPTPISSGAPDVAGETTEDIGGAPAESGGEAPAAPEVVAPPPFQFTEPELAMPGFNAGHR